MNQFIKFSTLSIFVFISSAYTQSFDTLKKSNQTLHDINTYTYKKNNNPYIIYRNDGTNYYISGNTISSSNGTEGQIIGNTIILDNNITCHIVGSYIDCE